jgi:uncharacterized protein (TIGR02145 family)
MATNTNGLIYYKLDANLHGYSGDITKNCGLRGEEIDGNFNFLRGNDIKSIQFDEKGTMFLTKYNGEILTAKQAETPEYDFNYNPESGSLTIVTPDGKEVVLTGFKVTTNVYHDYTLAGYGSQEYPLEISNQAKTGRYRPAIKLLDTTLEDENGRRLESLPMENNTKHDRYVTKEKISRFGRLFPLEGVEKIAERLKNISSEWHVPTKEEWDEILNVIDCATPTHSSKDSNVELGEFAGTVLKSVKYWEKAETGKLLAEDAYGFGVYPVGYCGNRGKKYYGSFGLSSAFWTATVEDNHKDMYVKTFDYNNETVGQRTWGENYYLSLRLVKKFTGNNFSDSEDIDGFTSNCVHIPGTSLIWTKDNIAFSQEQYDGFAPTEWKEYENAETDDNSYEIRYFVNDWNGNGWDKHEIKEGEGIVLYEGENGRMHEWLLVDGELIDTAILLKEEFAEEIDKINARLDKETADRIEGDQQLWDAVNQEIEARQNVDAQLWDAVNNETSRASSVEAQLWGAINQESESRENVDAQLWDAVNNEAQRAETVEKQIWEAIENETNGRLSVEVQLWDAINNEAVTRQDIDNQIWSELNKEINNRQEVDSDLQRQINENKVTANNNSVVIEPGFTNENKETIPTKLHVNIDVNCEHIKLGENGIYFDGNFGQF